MLFNSLEYLLVFLPIVVFGAHLLRDRWSQFAAQVWILIASLTFYGWNRPGNLGLLLASIAFNAAVGSRIVGCAEDSPARKRWLQLGLLVDLGVLCAFKYVGFLAPAIAHTAVGLALSSAIPLGISFYTLMQVMYLVDCYEALIPANSLFDHALYVSLFAHVTAGPLDRAKLVVAQHSRIGSQDDRWQNIARGLALVALGVVKKVVIADAFGRIADAGFGAIPDLSTFEAWVSSCSYTLQLYFDFSGYTDMALGSALMLGILLAKNFNAPYRATSISDFWRRWHISLSVFITTYLYTPIVRSLGRITLRTSIVATVLAMGIAGLWHGAAWTYVVFGLMHGVALAVNQAWKKLKRPLPAPLAWMVTFCFINLAFIPFRASTLADATTLTMRLVPHGTLFAHSALSRTIRGSEIVMIALPVIAGTVAAFIGPTSDEIAGRLKWTPRMALATSGLLLVSLLYLNSTATRDFVYFRF